MEQENPGNEILGMDKPLPLWFMFILPFYMVGILTLVVLPLAKDWSWLEAWIFIITFAVTMTIGTAIVNKHNPRVLRNRMKMKKDGLTAATKKSAGSDRWIMPLMSIGFFGALILPAWAHRLGWPALPFAVEMIGIVLTNIGLIIMNIAMLHNPYASKILDINQEQNLIDNGIYAQVRHPLYSGASLLIIAIPIALGSWYGIIPAAVGVLCLVVRIKFEEDMLVRGMKGYQDYQKRVKHKLIPKIY
jgi:protein-S-isoprenylcysteine O-methyltransferase Ste14